MSRRPGVLRLDASSHWRLLLCLAICVTTTMAAAIGGYIADSAQAASPSAATSGPIDVAVFPETRAEGLDYEDDQSRVQLAGSGPNAWVTWCDDSGTWAQRADLAETKPPILLTDDLGTCPLEAYPSTSGSAIVVLQEFDDTDNWFRTVRVTPAGATTVDRATIPEQILSDPAVGVSTAGAVMAYRLDPDEGRDYRILAITADSTGHLGTFTRLSEPSARLDAPGWPSAAIDDQGRVVVCWQQLGPQDPDETAPTPTYCRTREPGAAAFSAATTAWNARGLGVTSTDTDYPWLVDLQEHAIALAGDGSIGLLGTDDGAVANVFRAGQWGTTNVLAANQPTDYNEGDTATLFDSTGALQSAWVTDKSAPGGRRLMTATTSPDGATSTGQLDSFPTVGDVTTKVAPTPDGGVALLWSADRKRGGPLRISTSPPGQNAFSVPVNRDGRADRETLDIDVSPTPDRSWMALLQHVVDSSGKETGTGVISVMPVIPGSDPSRTGQPMTARVPAARAANTLTMQIGKPVVRHGALSVRVVCRNAHGPCSGHLIVTAKGHAPVSRQFKTRTTDATAQLRFAGVATRRLLHAGTIRLRVSGRSADGRVAASHRFIRRARLTRLESSSPYPMDLIGVDAGKQGEPA